MTLQNWLGTLMAYPDFTDWEAEDFLKQREKKIKVFISTYEWSSLKAKRQKS